MSGEKYESRFPGFSGLAEQRRDLARNLVALRMDAGLSQTQLAAMMGTSQSAVARIESGDADLRLSTIERYAAALGQVVEFELRSVHDQTAQQ